MFRNFEPQLTREKAIPTLFSKQYPIGHIVPIRPIFSLCLTFVSREREPNRPSPNALTLELPTCNVYLNGLYPRITFTPSAISKNFTFTTI